MFLNVFSHVLFYVFSFPFYWKSIDASIDVDPNSYFVCAVFSQLDSIEFGAANFNDSDDSDDDVYGNDEDDSNGYGFDNDDDPHDDNTDDDSDDDAYDSDAYEHDASDYDDDKVDDVAYGYDEDEYNV